MPTLTIPCETGQISDGYHTFDELYEHRCLLFLHLMKAHKQFAWFSRKHADNSELKGWFIAGIKTPFGEVTYHLPKGFWKSAITTGAQELQLAPPWDGHTSVDVLMRLQEWLNV